MTSVYDSLLSPWFMSLPQKSSGYINPMIFFHLIYIYIYTGNYPIWDSQIVILQHMSCPSHFLPRLFQFFQYESMQVQLKHKYWNSYRHLIWFLLCFAFTVPLLWSFFRCSAYWSNPNGPGYLKMVGLDNVPKSRAVPISPEMIINGDGCLDMSGIVLFLSFLQQKSPCAGTEQSELFWHIHNSRHSLQHIQEKAINHLWL